MEAVSYERYEEIAIGMKMPHVAYRLLWKMVDANGEIGKLFKTDDDVRACLMALKAIVPVLFFELAEEVGRLEGNPDDLEKVMDLFIKTGKVV